MMRPDLPVHHHDPNSKSEHMLTEPQPSAGPARDDLTEKLPKGIYQCCIRISGLVKGLPSFDPTMATDLTKVELDSLFMLHWTGQQMRAAFSSTGRLAAFTSGNNCAALSIVLFERERFTGDQKIILKQSGKAVLEFNNRISSPLSFWIDAWPGPGEEFPVIFWKEDDNSISIMQVEISPIQTSSRLLTRIPKLSKQQRDEVIGEMENSEGMGPRGNFAEAGPQQVFSSNYPDVALQSKDIGLSSPIALLPCCGANQFLRAYVDILKRLVVEVYELVETAGGSPNVRERLKSRFFVKTFKEHDFSAVELLELQRTSFTAEPVYSVSILFRNRRLLQLKIDDSGLAVQWISFELDKLLEELKKYGFPENELDWRPSIPTFGPNTLIMLSNKSNKLLIASQKNKTSEENKEFTVSIIKLSLII